MRKKHNMYLFLLVVSQIDPWCNDFSGVSLGSIWLRAGSPFICHVSKRFCLHFIWKYAFCQSKSEEFLPHVFMSSVCNILKNLKYVIGLQSVKTLVHVLFAKVLSLYLYWQMLCFFCSK